MIKIIYKAMKFLLNYNENKDDVVIIDDIKYSTKNSKGDYISNNKESIFNFYKWFGNSVMVDEYNCPMVCYHITHQKFDEFTPSKFGSMGAGIYFTTRINEYDKKPKYKNGLVYSCYLKIENPLYLDTPHSKREEDNNDGIISRFGQEGEEFKVYSSNQIKSINNDGTFDINDKNIYS